MQSDREQQYGHSLAQAKKHLSAIESGMQALRDSPSTVDAGALCQAARGIRDSALAGGLANIETLARGVEDAFQVVQLAQGEPVSPRLQALIQRAADTLKGLVEMQEMALLAPESSYLTEDVEREVMASIQPVLVEMQEALEQSLAAARVTSESPFADFIGKVRLELERLAAIAESSSADGRRTEVQARCQQLRLLGEREGVPGWTSLLETARAAVARTDLPVSTAARAAIADIHHACELLLADRLHDIRASAALKALATPSQERTAASSLDDLAIQDALANAPTIDEDLMFAALSADEASEARAAGSERADDDFDYDAWDEAEDDSLLVSSEGSLKPHGNANAMEESDEFAQLFGQDYPDAAPATRPASAPLIAEEAAIADWGTHGSDAVMPAGEIDRGSESDPITIIDGSPVDTDDEVDWLTTLEGPNSLESGTSSQRDGDSLDSLEELFADEAEDTFIQDDEDPAVVAAASRASLAGFPLAFYPTFDALDDLIAQPAAPAAIDFEALEQTIDKPAIAIAGSQPNVDLEATKMLTVTGDERFEDADFFDLESLLPQMSESGRAKVSAPSLGSTRGAPGNPRSAGFEQTLKVPVRIMDGLSNLMGELVVSRNNLEQDRERLRRFLDNLLEQVQNLNDLGGRMQDLYERSLLESSLLASKYAGRPAVGTGGIRNSERVAPEYDPLEMDRFTGFHLISQEMMEMIVRVRESSADIEFLVDEIDKGGRTLRQVTTQMQEDLTKARMVPFSQISDRLPRAVRDIALKLKKQAKLEVDGKETLVDKMLLEQLYDPLTHLVNNAITHGIESPGERKTSGKSADGNITIRALHQGNQTLIAISDDGAGIDPGRIRSKAIEKGLVGEAEARELSDLEIYNFIFHPGFSTKEKADDFAGRGVGMDVVRSTLSKLRGTIAIDSTPGKGTTFTIGLPLTLSITKALCCLNEHSRIAFPMDGVEGMFDVPVEALQTRDSGERMVPWQKADGTIQLLPFKPLSELLTFNRQLTRGNVYGGQREDGHVSVVLLRSPSSLVAVEVDQVMGEQEIVIKQLHGPIPKPAGVAGATVLGDGSVMAIADTLELVDLFQGRLRLDLICGSGATPTVPEFDAVEASEIESDPLVLIVDDSITVRELLSVSFIKSGFRVEQARDGQEAWEKLRSGLPCDIVFCDIEMPRMDGLELLSRLQQDEVLSRIPVGMLTSRGADRHRQMAAKLGARGYFTKPYLEEVLLDAAQRMIEGEVLLD
ncbi:chemotaxis protein histidine kinase [Rubidibacter lacunae KORDI 51-2]|uniref:histidine kinase n=1 Tax=Rubidibacter lacunae KORDI 51-2 TaxID=582515 RepID=U5D953_9CHRO|nr:response regulator [Rubidibacter lacunae]ERN41098.1 chemotaxis protein histidine kinase [Rubidibacter lacunae KORDI 51-2]